MLLSNKFSRISSRTRYNCPPWKQNTTTVLKQINISINPIKYGV